MHPGGTKIYHDLRCQYYWSGMEKHVGDFVRRCLTCQRVKAEHQRPAGLLQPWKIVEWRWEHVTMDFMTHLPRTSGGHDVMCVIMDRLTKLAHFLAMRMTFTLKEFSRLYIREIIAEVYRALRSTREGWYSYLSIGTTTKFIECSCGIPCLHASEVH